MKNTSITLEEDFKSYELAEKLFEKIYGYKPEIIEGNQQHEIIVAALQKGMVYGAKWQAEQDKNKFSEEKLKQELPSAEEFLLQEGMTSLHLLNEVLTLDGKEGSQGERLIKAIINFTRMHVQACKEDIAANIEYDQDHALHRQSVLQAYPETNIK